MIDLSGSSFNRQALSRALLGRDVVRRVGQLLGGRGIPVMPLKGILMQQLIYADPSERRISDVDLLVPDHRFQEAVSSLSANGYQPVALGRSLIEIAFRSPTGITVDLHRQLFSPYRYRLSTLEVFERSSPNEHLFDVPVRLAHPLDTLAHLIGKWVSDQVAGGCPHRLRDIERWVALYRISPQAAATHLEKVGLARAYRYVLNQVALPSRPFFCQTLDALSIDPVGRACLAVASRLFPLTRATIIAALPAHLLNSTLIRAGASMTTVLVRRGIYQYLQDGRGPAPKYLRSCVAAISSSGLGRAK